MCVYTLVCQISCINIYFQTYILFHKIHCGAVSIEKDKYQSQYSDKPI